MNSGGHSDDVDTEFYNTIGLHVDVMTDEITDLQKIPHDNPGWPAAAHAIEVKSRAIDYLRALLPAGTADTIKSTQTKTEAIRADGLDQRASGTQHARAGPRGNWQIEAQPGPSGTSR